MFSTRDHACLNYTGRVVYNYSIPFGTGDNQHEIHARYNYVKTSYYGVTLKVGSEGNVFRVNNESKKHGNPDRCYSVKVNTISDMIIAKRWVDKSILKEINLLADSISSATYANSFSLDSLVTSNIETHYFSKHKYHVTHISSMGTYSSMDFSCFDSIDNKALQEICAGKNNNISNTNSVNLSQMLSLFLCETSRNPAAFLTFPMCLELAEKIHSFLKEENGRQKIKEALDQIHEDSTTYQELLTRRANSNLSTQEQSKITKEFNSKFIDSNAEDIANTPKSKVVKDVILSLFPLAMKNAVQASREISAHINKKLDESQQQNVDISKLNHEYDRIAGSLSDAKKFLKVEKMLIKQYKQYVLQNQNIDYKTIVSNWFDIDIDIDSCEVLIAGSVSTNHALIDLAT